MNLTKYFLSRLVLRRLLLRSSSPLKQRNPTNSTSSMRMILTSGWCLSLSMKNSQRFQWFQKMHKSWARFRFLRPCARTCKSIMFISSSGVYLVSANLSAYDIFVLPTIVSTFSCERNSLVGVSHSLFPCPLFLPSLLKYRFNSFAGLWLTMSSPLQNQALPPCWKVY